jgi:mono/diheme cytochrome c family protein
MIDTCNRNPATAAIRLLLLAATLLLSPLTTVDAADVFKGKTVYESYCAGCHGPSGRGEMPGTPNFTRGQQLIRPDLSLFAAISTGKNAMPGFRGILTENEMLDVITYIRTFY